MKNQWLNPARFTVVARILAAALAVFWAATQLMAADVKLTRLSPNLIEIAADNWRLRYGTNSRSGGPAPQLLQTDEKHAYYAYGGWLRLVDPGEGVVVGRWHFPGSIVRLTPAGDQIEIEIEDEYSISQVFRRTLRFDPRVPVVPYWPAEEDYSLHRLPICEAQVFKPQATFCRPDVAPVPAAEAQKMIVELEDAVRRDPLAPWHGIVLGKLLRDIGDPRAAAIFQRAVQIEATDFTELLPISAFLLSLGEREFARIAFERGYRNFWVVGNDPRLFTFLQGQLFLFNLKWVKLSLEDRTEWIERTYRLQPYGASEMAWRSYANYLKGEGRNDEARLWDLRARDTAAHSMYKFNFPLVAAFDQVLMCFPTLIVSVIFYVLVLYVRYRPQKELDIAAASRTGVHRRKSSLLNIVYWSRRERVAFLTIILASWCAAGVTGYLAGGIRRLFKAPVTLGSGSLAGPVTSWFLENHLPATPGRDLLLAVASQQDGQVEKAERLYRQLPDFPESWNNLGVILKETGKTQEAQHAFEQALKLDPTLDEAMLNLGRPPGNLWTESHKQYLGDRPMIAPPRRKHMVQAVLGTSRTQAVLRVLLGPYMAPWVAVLGIRFAHFWWAPHLLFLILYFSLAILFVVPRRDVTQPAGSKQWIWEMLLPGTSPAWGWLGGLALLAWSYFLIQIVLLVKYGTPRIISGFLAPDVPNGYGIPLTDGFDFLNPSWAWIYLPPALFFIVNLVLVWRARASTSSTVG